MKKNKFNIRATLSCLWIVVLVNMIFADIFSLVIEIKEGGLFEIPTDVKTMMAIAAVLTNIPISMVILSRVLPVKWNKISNIIAATFTIIYVIGGGSLVPHYIIIASFEVILLLIILTLSLKWKNA